MRLMPYTLTSFLAAVQYYSIKIDEVKKHPNSYVSCFTLLEQLIVMIIIGLLVSHVYHR
jgi:prepilin-type N-terminal cleavage/methylation domain-containing protein